jgi:hypothetical protein
MDTIRNIEAHLAGLTDGQEIIRFKAIRNALTPFGRLPDELMIQIAQDASTICDGTVLPEVLNILTSVYDRLRCVLVGTPGLWARISLNWNKAAVDLYLARAASYPLSISLVTEGVNEDVCEHIAQCSPTTTSLDICINGRVGRNFIDRCVVANTPQLRDLTVALLNHTRSLRMDQECFIPHSCANLSTLKIYGVHPANLPAMPSLQYVTLKRTNCSLLELHQLFSAAPQLKFILLMWSLHPHSTHIPASGCVHLPNLECVDIEDEPALAAAIVEILPNPSTMFKVLTYGLDWPFQVWSSSGPSGRILLRMIEFWAEVTGGMEDFPAGHIESTAVDYDDTDTRECIVFSEGPYLWEKSRSLQYRSICRITRNDPLLQHIKSLHIDCEGWADVGLDVKPDHINLSCLSNLEHLFITAADCETDSEDRKGHTQALENWIIERQQEGKPLRSVRFWYCKENVKGLFNRFVAGQVAQFVTWN